MKYINIGIDLGTTNSGICEFKDGKITILKNPVGFKETMPSVVAFLKNRMLVGDKANELLLSSPDAVFSSFKRKMGTNEIYKIPVSGEETNPAELSSFVLKELFNFYQAGELDAAVITIPASFDTIQSNATKEAGKLSGLSHVNLLQEPIAACLAYANTNNLNIEQKTNWIVYDFGGGTFDSAIVAIDEREMKVQDHNGDNFLGGLDIDLAIISNIIVPNLEKITSQKNLNDKLNSGDSNYQKLSKYLLYKAEELKKELSVKKEGWVEINYPEFELEIEFSVTRSEFDEVVAPFFNQSFKCIEELLEDNQMTFSDFERLILVGGTTYIPFIREKLAEKCGITIDYSTDPTTAVMIGAAYYAGNKTYENAKESETEVREIPTNEINESRAEQSEEMSVDVLFETATQDDEELISVRVNNGFKGFYRIIRKDGGYDSGMIPFENTTNEFVSILPKNINNFELTLFDNNKIKVFTKSEISISHGFYSVDGQPLPNDICIELDSDEDTYLEKIFTKNQLLPLNKTIYKTFSKSIPKGSKEKIIINIVEGKVGTSPGANLNIGYIEISGKDLKDDLIRGTDIEMDFHISESRDLKVTIFIPSADQEIEETFNPQYQGELSKDKLLIEINNGLRNIDEYIDELGEEEENFELMARYNRIKNELIDIKLSLQINKNN
ncbi:MAG: Hsp70 family protein, partial [Flavobacteriales bacterium]